MNGSQPAVAVRTVCVYCGSRIGAQAAYREAALQLGEAIGRRGWRLVYGGGHVGLMGAVADATLKAGGQVLGVIPRLLMDKEVGHAGLTELVVVDNMHQRKQQMAEAADAFIALPGGIGTLEELFEVWTWRHLGYHDRPVGLLNTAGYYDSLLAFMRHTESQGFIDAEQQAMLWVATEADTLLDRIAAQPGRTAMDLSRS